MKKVVKIFSLSALALVIGVVIAYHNTASFGYDREYVVTIYNDSIKILDYNIELENIRKVKKHIKDAVPDDFVTI